MYPKKITLNPLFRSFSGNLLLSGLCSVLISLVFFLASCTPTETVSDKPKELKDDSIAELFKNKQHFNIDSIRLLIKAKQEDKAALFVLHYELGRYYRGKTKFSDAVEHHQIALLIAETEKDTISIIKTSNQLGTDFRRISLLPNAASAHFKALKIAEEYSQKKTPEGRRLRSFSLNGVGNIYKTMGKGAEAFQYFKKSLVLDDSLQNYLGMAMNLVTIGSIKEHEDKLDSAYIYYLQAMHYDSLINSTTGVAICHNRIGQLFSKKKEWDKSLKHYNSALELLKEKGNTWNKLKTENEIAFIYIKQKKYDKAENILQRIKETAKERKLYGYLMQTYYLLGMVYEEKNRFKESAEAWKLCIDYTDSIQKISNNRKVVDSRVAFEREMSNNRIKNIHKVNEEERSKRRQFLMVSIIISLLLLALFLLAFFLLRTQRKRNLSLRESNRVRDKLFSIISHDLKSPAIAQKMAIDTLKPQIETLENKELKNYFEILEQYTENQLNIIVNLLNWARTQSDAIAFKPQNINIVKTIEEEINLYIVAMQQKNIHLHKDLPESCIVFVDYQMIGIVIRNLINNAVKFTGEGGHITISGKCSNENVQISIADNGIGMPEGFQNNINPKEEQNINVRRGTKGEKGTGLGLILCKDLLKRNGSSLTIKSKTGEGTTMQFVLKKGL